MSLRGFLWVILSHTPWAESAFPFPGDSPREERTGAPREKEGQAPTGIQGMGWGSEVR